MSCPPPTLTQSGEFQLKSVTNKLLVVQVYKAGRKPAVDRLCLGIPRSEVRDLRTSDCEDTHTHTHPLAVSSVFFIHVVTATLSQGLFYDIVNAT